MSARLREHLLLAVWSVVLFALCYALNTRNNRFPFTYHPDEGGKVEQVLKGDWNFHHPMLLLTVTNLAVQAFGVPREEQPIVEAGRRVSAAFTAAAVVALSLLAYLWRGWIAAFTAGGGLALHHQLYELSHYMKEDTALLMGLAFTFLAALAYSQRASCWRAVLLGVSVGLAISGKYVGVVVLGVALPVLWKHSGDSRGRRCAVFGAALLAVIVAVNLPLLLDPLAFLHSLGRETTLVIEGQGDTTRRVPHLLYWNVFIDNSMPLLWLFLVTFMVMAWQRRATLTLAERLIILFPFAYTVALSFLPKENDRYFFPATALFTLLACLGVLDAPRLVYHALRILGVPQPERALGGRWRWEAVAAAAIGFMVMQFTGWTSTKPGWLAYDSAFQHDDLADLTAWMRVNLPPDAKVAADGRVGLIDLSRKRNSGRTASVPQAVSVSRFASDLGTLDELRQQGYGYVAVSESSYGGFFRSGLRAKDAKDQKFRAGQAFYEDLLRGVPLFDRERGTVIYLHPGIRVYRIADVAPMAG